MQLLPGGFEQVERPAQRVLFTWSPVAGNHALSRLTAKRSCSGDVRIYMTGHAAHPPVGRAAHFTSDKIKIVARYGERVVTPSREMSQRSFPLRTLIDELTRASPSPSGGAFFLFTDF
jgi:hypothetical protein